MNIKQFSSKLTYEARIRQKRWRELNQAMNKYNQEKSKFSSTLRHQKKLQEINRLLSSNHLSENIKQNNQINHLQQFSPHLIGVPPAYRLKILKNIRGNIHQNKRSASSSKQLNREKGGRLSKQKEQTPPNTYRVNHPKPPVPQIKSRPQTSIRMSYYNQSQDLSSIISHQQIQPQKSPSNPALNEYRKYMPAKEIQNTRPSSALKNKTLHVRIPRPESAKLKKPQCGGLEGW